VRGEQTPVTPADVLSFWFGGGEPRFERWFAKDPALDDPLRERFGATLEEAATGALDEAWTASPKDTLALIILLDQFSRNIYRGSARMFAQDARALGIARRGLSRGDDARLSMYEAAFFYLPFEHAEDLPTQEEAVRLFTAPPAGAAGGEGGGEELPRLRHPAPGHRRALRPLPAPQRAAGPELDARGAGVPPGARVVLLTGRRRRTR
jgi:uncharacterized protein (DUF924 family)